MKLTRTVYLDVRVGIFFVLTETCRTQGSETPCDQLRLGPMSFVLENSFIAPGSIRTRSAPGYRITKHIDVSYFVSPDTGLKTLEAVKARAIENDEPAPEDDGRYRAKVYIYCPPCACHIVTALEVCQYSYKKDLVDFCVRIDHRQKTSCSASVSTIEGLISVVDHLKEEEKEKIMKEHTVKSVKAIDREWLEKQIYEYTEEDRMATFSPIEQLARVVEFHKDEPSCAAIILLGEADYCIPLMEAPPFPPLEPGRLPRETQLFKMWIKWFNDSRRYRWDREYMGTYSPKDPLPRKRPAPVGSDATQRLVNVQRGSKRPRSSISEQEGS